MHVAALGRGPESRRAFREPVQPRPKRLRACQNQGPLHVEREALLRGETVAVLRGGSGLLGAGPKECERRKAPGQDVRSLSLRGMRSLGGNALKVRQSVGGRPAPAKPARLIVFGGGSKGLEVPGPRVGNDGDIDAKSNRIVRFGLATNSGRYGNRGFSVAVRKE